MLARRKAKSFVTGSRMPRSREAKDPAARIYPRLNTFEDWRRKDPKEVFQRVSPDPVTRNGKAVGNGRHG